MIKTNRNRGFSLVELIVTICILAAIAAFLIPSLINLMQQSRIKKDETKFNSICTAFKSACSEPEVQKEADRIGGGGNLTIVYYIHDNGLIDFNSGELIGTSSKPMQETSLWLCSYQSVGTTYTTESPEFSNEYLVFTLTPKTAQSTAQCTYEVVDSYP
jgi:prepilin-type N-terminal cleavage/methylation domain-containing protein